MTTITTVHTEMLEASQMPPVSSEVEGGIAVFTTASVQLRSSKEFAKLNEALDFCALLDSLKIKKVHLNVNLINAKRDRYGRLAEVDYPWTVSYPAADQSKLEAML